MAKLSILAGTTSKLVDVFIQDTSVTTGAGLTGLTNLSSSLTWYYYREGAASAVQVASIASMTLGTWVTKGFIVVDGTNMPGVYQLGVPDAALAAGAKSVVMMLKGATNMAAVVLEIELTAIDNQNATSFGVTDLDAAVSTRLAASSYTAPSNLTAAQIATGIWQDATAGDFTTASSIGKALYVSNVAPGGSGGHLISGSNAGTTTFGALTVTGAMTYTGNMVLSDGLTISAPSTLNRAGITITGNGTGAAISGTGGATGQGVLIAGGGTSGDGIKVTTTSGHGINLAPVGTNMHGLLSTGGNGGTSDGIKAAAGTGGVDIRGNITGNLVGTVSTLTTNSDKTGYSLTADFRIKKNTALAAFPFRMTDSTDHFTPKTGLTVTGTVSLDGGAFGALTNAVSEIGNGWYKVSLAAADLNADTVALKFTSTGADQLDITVVTQTE